VLLLFAVIAVSEICQYDVRKNSVSKKEIVKGSCQRCEWKEFYFEHLL